ncbi:DUF6036 family nucleotidyltransferase [Aquabacterium sp.]|uniref:DUF6036 family nucleotidyltransferase n=1 Tax=Aquabacterium sp. TaxID=1872578 RepID=UPI002C7D2B1C|nr:DUF6036 family nucleotidyltransferase [Aquabacterium sp.]HSW05113.1 DUF6036 family nucleotidyltransferase [Aquabacterium sp.]
MNLEALFDLFRQARKLCGHQDFVVIGSLSILGLSEHFQVPDDMTMSNDVDCYTKNDPDRVFDLLAALGENSPYHQRSGYYLDAVAPGLPSLPEGWGERLLKVEHDGLRLWFLDPNDAALSKYARGEPRDRRWIQAGIRVGVVSLPVVSARWGSTNFLDADEQQRARCLVEEDQAWFALVKAGRQPPEPEPR